MTGAALSGRRRHPRTLRDIDDDVLHDPRNLNPAPHPRTPPNPRAEAARSASTSGAVLDSRHTTRWQPPATAGRRPVFAPFIHAGRTPHSAVLARSVLDRPATTSN